MTFKALRSCVVLVALALAAPPSAGASVFDSLPPDVLARGGLCVVVGAAEELASPQALLGSGSWLVHGLDAREEAVEQARRALHGQGVYGRVSVEQWDEAALPYGDNLVNLIVVPDASQAPGREELMRVLAPEGWVFMAQGDSWARVQKPRPAELGDWTHYWQGADGNLASADRAVDVFDAFQWIAGPVFHLGGRRDILTMLVAGGRQFSVTRDAPGNLDVPDRFRPSSSRAYRYNPAGEHYLIARDGFNGLPLWSRVWDGTGGEAMVASLERIYYGRSASGERRGEVVVLDAATGDEIAVWPADERPRKLLLSDGVLVVETPDGLSGFDTHDGEAMWSREIENPWGSLASGGRVFYMVGTRQVDGRWKHELATLDLRAGDDLWRHTVESEVTYGSSAALRMHFVGEGVVCVVEDTRLYGLSSEDGRTLWRREGEASSRGSQDSRRVGHFFVDGLVWMRANRARGGREAPETWLALDPLTGEVRRQLDATGSMGVVANVNKISCQRLTASQRFVFDARLSTIWDFETGERHGWKFARGGCVLGTIPANGLGYVPPNACGCLAQQWRGNLALVRSDAPGLASQSPGPLQRGPAYGMAPTPRTVANAAEWPMYRRDGRRGASLPVNASPGLEERWTAEVALGDFDFDDEWRLRFGRPLSPPVVADGMVALARPQTHEVIALDQRTGAERWRFTACGRVSVPPTLHGGLALFGTHTGYVYALRAEDGALVWRRRAAPTERRIMAYGQIESEWPILGGVLIQDGLALVAAGRAGDSGGGIVVHGFDPASGEARWSTSIEDPRHGVADLLVTDGVHAHLMDYRLYAQTGEASRLSGFRHAGGGRAGSGRLEFPEGVRYLRGGKAGLHERAWTFRGMALRKGQSTWWLGEMEGELMAFDDDSVFAFQVDAGEDFWGGAPPRVEGGQVHARISGSFSERPVPADGWRFRLDPDDAGRDAGWFAPGLDDGDWRDDVPIETGWLAHLDDGYQGAGWYRRVIDAPAFENGTAAFLRFEGVDEEAWVWVNGEFAGSHEEGTSGYDVPFEIDVTDHLEPGQPNLIAVRAKNTVGDGGIWRPVALRLFDQEPVEWTREMESSAQVEAMLSTENLLVIAGPDDRDAPQGTGFLRVLARDDGRELAHVSLPVAPVHDGLAAANGSVIAVLRNGTVVSFDASE